MRRRAEARPCPAASVDQCSARPAFLSAAWTRSGAPRVAPVHAADGKDGEIGWFGPRARREGHVAQPRVLYTDGFALPAVSSARVCFASPTPTQSRCRTPRHPVLLRGPLHANYAGCRTLDD